MADVLEVNRSSYYKWKKEPMSKRKKEDIIIGEKVKEIFEARKN